MFRPSTLFAVVLCASPIVAQVRLEGPNGPLVGNLNDCAKRSDRAVECGSSNIGRFDSCW